MIRGLPLWSRNPATLAERIRSHLPWILLSGGALTLTSWIPPGQWPFRLCLLNRLLHVPCLLCGTTRVFQNAGRGQWREAWTESPLGMGLLLGVWAVFLFHSAAWIDRKKWILNVPFSPRTRRIFLLLTLAALLANWVYRFRTGRI
ncbi:MAG: DUF2752 domain-containing protein [Kiritimatiellia bacterium]|nr:DUF2752 domain-containing protein [Kiritimatiellia bacterium]